MLFSVAGFTLTIAVDQKLSRLWPPATPRTGTRLQGNGAWCRCWDDARFLPAVSEGPCQRRIAALRCQFPYMKQGSKLPDREADIPKLPERSGV
jgi:hypothetical protein